MTANLILGDEFLEQLRFGSGIRDKALTAVDKPADYDCPARLVLLKAYRVCLNSGIAMWQFCEIRIIQPINPPLDGGKIGALPGA